MNIISKRARFATPFAALAAAAFATACGSGGPTRSSVSASERALVAGLGRSHVVFAPDTESGPIRLADAPAPVRTHISSLGQAYQGHTATFFGDVPEVNVGRTGHRHVRLAIEARVGVHASSPFVRPVYVIWVDESLCDAYPLAPSCLSPNRGLAQLVSPGGRVLGNFGMRLGGLDVADVSATGADSPPHGWLASLADHGVLFGPIARGEPPAGLISASLARAAALHADAHGNPAARAVAYLGHSSETNGLVYLVRITGVKQYPLGGICMPDPKRPHRCIPQPRPEPNREVNAFIDAHTGEFISDASFR